MTHHCRQRISGTHLCHGSSQMSHPGPVYPANGHMGTENRESLWISGNLWQLLQKVGTVLRMHLVGLPSRLFAIAFPGVDYAVCVILMAALTGVYVILGGYMATAWNDFIH